MINFTVTTDDATANVIIDALQERLDGLRALKKGVSTIPQQSAWYENKIVSLEKAIKDMQDTAVKA